MSALSDPVFEIRITCPRCGHEIYFDGWERSIWWEALIEYEAHLRTHKEEE